jgi:hypothetical protein
MVRAKPRRRVRRLKPVPPGTIRDAIRTLGYRASFVLSKAGVAEIRAVMGDRLVAVEVHRCHETDELAGYVAATFHAELAMPLKVADRLAATWGRTERAVRLVTHGDLLVVEMDLLHGGPTRYLRAQILHWSCLLWQLTEGARATETKTTAKPRRMFLRRLP